MSDNQNRSPLVERLLKILQHEGEPERFERWLFNEERRLNPPLVVEEKPAASLSRGELTAAWQDPYAFLGVNRQAFIDAVKNAAPYGEEGVALPEYSSRLPETNRISANKFPADFEELVDNDIKRMAKFRPKLAAFGAGGKTNGAISLRRITQGQITTKRLKKAVDLALVHDGRHGFLPALPVDDFLKDIGDWTRKDFYLLGTKLAGAGIRSMIEVIVLKVLADQTEHFKTMAMPEGLGLKRPGPDAPQNKP